MSKKEITIKDQKKTTLFLMVCLLITYLLMKDGMIKWGSLISLILFSVYFVFLLFIDRK